MAQFKQFLRQLQITERVKPIPIIGGKKTIEIGDVTVKPPKPIKSSVKHPRGVPGNKTHAKSVAVKEEKLEEKAKVAPAGVLIPNKERPWMRDTSSTRTKRKYSKAISTTNNTGTASTTNNTDTASTTNNANTVNNANVVKKASPRNRKYDITVSKRKSTNHILDVLGKKHHGSVSPKGFIHPQVSKVTSKK